MTALLEAIVPRVSTAAPELAREHALTLLSIDPGLRDLLHVPDLLARALSLSREGNSRLYTARLAHGVTDFLLAALVPTARSRATVCFENVHAADALDRELIAVLLERADPRTLRITVTTPAREMDEPLLTALLDRASVRLVPPPDIGTSGDADRRVAALSRAGRRALARRYVESDCTSEDHRARRAYELSDAELRRRLHGARLSTLHATPSLSRSLGAIPFHAERSATPDVEPLVEASARCIRMGYYEASLDLSRRGMRMIGGAAGSRAFGELGRNIVFSLLLLGRNDEVEAYCREIESSTDEPALRSHCAYAMAILNARLYPAERRDYGAARAWVEAAIAFTEALPDSETKVVNLVFLQNPLALVAIRTGRNEEALRLLTEALRRLEIEAPAAYAIESIILLRNRARIHLAMGRPERALDDYSALLDLEPTNSEAHLDRGVLLQQMGRPHEALEDHDAAVRWSPPYAEAYFDRALVLRALGRDGDALLDLAHVLALEPRHTAALVNRAGLLYERRNYAESREDVERVLTIDPRDAKAWCLTGLLEMAARRWPEARRAFDRALACDAAEHTALLNRATLLVREGDVAGALTDLEAVIEKHADATALYNRGRLHESQGRFEEAIADYTRALELGGPGARDAAVRRDECRKRESSENRSPVAEAAESSPPAFGVLRRAGRSAFVLAACASAAIQAAAAFRSAAASDVVSVASAKPATLATKASLGVAVGRAAELLRSHQRSDGSWFTVHTRGPRFEDAKPEINTFTTAMILDVLDEVAAAAGVGKSLSLARGYLSSQIEADGLVRYHGRPDGPNIPSLGCAITPDADDTALVWRLAGVGNPPLLPRALAVLARYRTPEGLYRTWLSPREGYTCIDPGKDPNPTDVGIQMHVLLLLANADPPAARALCRALGGAIEDDRVWVYYQAAPLVPLLRQADLRRAGCALRVPEARLRTFVAGQDVWIAAGRLLDRLRGGDGPRSSSSETLALLLSLAGDDFSAVRRNPPLLYHNDFTARTPRFYWSEDFGYALWLRLYLENANR